MRVDSSRIGPSWPACAAAIPTSSSRRQSPAPATSGNRNSRVTSPGLALYVTSGWDVQFATDLDGTVEALRSVHLDAVIAEHDVADGRWQPVLTEARRMQPGSRRIVRGALAGPAPATPLVHRFVDRDAGLDALLDALTADLGVGG